jgi:hypothetical protein
MTFGQEIEPIRKLRGYTIIDMCDILGVHESEYKHIISHGGPLNTYQKYPWLLRWNTHFI